jgi:hypothetical protein
MNKLGLKANNARVDIPNINSLLVDGILKKLNHDFIII